jgi:hypothetical protein
MEETRKKTLLGTEEPIMSMTLRSRSRVDLPVPSVPLSHLIVMIALPLPFDRDSSRPIS